MRKRVAVLVQSARGYGRGVLTGIGAFARANRTWSIFHDERILADSVPDWFRQWRGDGVIASFETEELIDVVVENDVPAVDLHGLIQKSGIPAVLPQDAQAVRLAYQHLRETGFQRIAFCGFKGIAYSDNREAMLQQLVSEEGGELIVLDSLFPHTAHTSRIEADGLLDQEALIGWLASLAKPIGIVACNDIRGAQVLNAAREAGIRVPDEIAVVGMDNDEFVCGLCDPPLSSVNLDCERIGFRAAAMLDDLMNGGREQPQVTRFEAAGVVVRESSDIMAVDDDAVAAAMRFIHQQAGEGLTVDDVVAVVPVSRSTLERRFVRSVGRSIKSEISRVRLKRVKELLVSTDYTLDRLANIVGFAHAEYMHRFFKAAVGVTPGEYRREHTRLSTQTKHPL